jgi:hypothetical protein
LLRLGLLMTSVASFSNAITFNPVQSSNIDLSNLGRVGLAGDFDGISLYQFQGQSENGYNTNDSQSVLSQFPNGGFATLASSDATIRAMCSFVMEDGTTSGIIVGGNFTSLGGINSPGAAMFNPNSSAVTPLTGLSGQVSALLCDQDTNTVYLGGNLIGVNSTNAIAWVGSNGWTNLPFNGFNGPVTSITKASNGHIIFGGEFTALGNTTSFNELDQQVINIAGANFTSGSSNSTPGFSDPSSIVCKTNGTDGPGETWLLADTTPGFLDAEFGFGFSPTKLRLWNTHLDGRGTKTWRYTAHPIDGIMNFTYIDPVTGQNSSCTSQCPLSNSTSVPYQDFYFVNVIGMNGFRVDISDWYGNGGGLTGIELFENDIFAYAVNNFNEPTCAGIQIPSEATNTGPWTISPSLQSLSGFLTATVTESESASVVFLPDIKQSGNYSVNMYTPGCIEDNSCSSRGRITINGTLSSGSSSATFTTEIYQTNNFDKYDQIYVGYIDAGTASFRPSITLAPVPGQNTPDLSVVAQRVGFTLTSPAGGLNNLFEYDPSQLVFEPANFTNSTFDQAGLSLGTGSMVNALATAGSSTFVGGHFSTSNFKYIFAIDGTTTNALSGGGLNGAVLTMFVNGTTVYVGGAFTNTSTGGVFGISNVATYDASQNAWGALGAGVNGSVSSIVPLVLNVTANVPETVITLTGDFSEILAFGDNSSIAADGFAVWVPSQGNWLQNLDVATTAIDGELTASVDIPGSGTLLAGSLSSAQLGVNGIVGLSAGPSLTPLPVNIQSSQSQSSLTKRDTSSQNYSGVVTGVFYENGGRNVTILGGHFTATGSNGSDINNLLFLNGSNSDITTGVGSSLSSDSTILALAVQGDTLYAGGSLTGTVNGDSVDGLITYDLLTSTFPSQPPSLGGGSVSVLSISMRPSSTDVYVGGSFSSAGSLECPGVCVFTSNSQWNRPGSNLGGTANVMLWTSSDSLTVGGALTFNNGNISLATYDATSQVWSEADGASAIPGPVTALAAANSDASQLWVAGTAANGSAFLMNYDGTNWNAVDGLGAGTTILGLQMLPLTTDHASSSLIATGETLMVTGALTLPGFGNASAALFNGSSFEPFILTTSSSNTGGSLSQIFSQEQNFFSSEGKW